jgi:hypothetical protein
MMFIAHRINTVEELRNVPVEYGVEIDLRDRGDRLILQHEPFTDGEDFEEYLRHYRHGLMILNIKSERIEMRVLALVRKYNIKKYFFLDSSFPMIVHLAKHNVRRVAVRFSEFEAIETALAMKGLVQWVWVDCFTRLPIDAKTWRRLKDVGFRLCLVSPELQGRKDEIAAYRDRLKQEGIAFDAICTKYCNVPQWIG